MGDFAWRGLVKPPKVILGVDTDPSPIAPIIGSDPPFSKMGARVSFFPSIEIITPPLSLRIPDVSPLPDPVIRSFDLGKRLHEDTVRVTG